MCDYNKKEAYDFNISPKKENCSTLNIAKKERGVNFLEEYTVISLWRDTYGRA